MEPFLEKPGQTLQATALVHDAYIRLVDVETAKDGDSREQACGIQGKPRSRERSYNRSTDNGRNCGRRDV